MNKKKRQASTARCRFKRVEVSTPGTTAKTLSGDKATLHADRRGVLTLCGGWSVPHLDLDWELLERQICRLRGGESLALTIRCVDGTKAFRCVASDGSGAGATLTRRSPQDDDDDDGPRALLDFAEKVRELCQRQRAKHGVAAGRHVESGQSFDERRRGRRGDGGPLVSSPLCRSPSSSSCRRRSRPGLAAPPVGLGRRSGSGCAAKQATAFSMAKPDPRGNDCGHHHGDGDGDGDDSESDAKAAEPTRTDESATSAAASEHLPASPPRSPPSRRSAASAASSPPSSSQQRRLRPIYGRRASGSPGGRRRQASSFYVDSVASRARRSLEEFSAGGGRGVATEGRTVPLHVGDTLKRRSNLNGRGRMGCYDKMMMTKDVFSSDDERENTDATTYKRTTNSNDERGDDGHSNAENTLVQTDDDGIHGSDDNSDAGGGGGAGDGEKEKDTKRWQKDDEETTELEEKNSTLLSLAMKKVGRRLAKAAVPAVVRDDKKKVGDDDDSDADYFDRANDMARENEDYMNARGEKRKVTKTLCDDDDIDDDNDNGVQPAFTDATKKDPGSRPLSLLQDESNMSAMSVPVTDEESAAADHSPASNEEEGTGGNDVTTLGKRGTPSRKKFRGNGGGGSGDGKPAAGGNIRSFFVLATKIDTDDSRKGAESTKRCLSGLATSETAAGKKKMEHVDDGMNDGKRLENLAKKARIDKCQAVSEKKAEADTYGAALLVHKKENRSEDASDILVIDDADHVEASTNDAGAERTEGGSHSNRRWSRCEAEKCHYRMGEDGQEDVEAAVEKEHAKEEKEDDANEFNVDYLASPKSRRHNGAPTLASLAAEQDVVAVLQTPPPPPPPPKKAATPSHPSTPGDGRRSTGEDRQRLAGDNDGGSRNSAADLALRHSPIAASRSSLFSTSSSDVNSTRRKSPRLQKNSLAPSLSSSSSSATASSTTKSCSRTPPHNPYKQTPSKVNHTGKDAAGERDLGAKFRCRSDDNVAVGLWNLGNTCYLNASVQMLLGVPGFFRKLERTYSLIVGAAVSDGKKTKKKEVDEIANESVSMIPLTTALLRVARSLRVLGTGGAASAPRDDVKDGECDTVGGSARRLKEDGRLAFASDAANDDEHENKTTMPAYPSSSSPPLVADPTCLKRVVDSLTSKFAGYEQRDAHEFASDLIDALHDELSEARRTVRAGMGRRAEGKEKGGETNANVGADDDDGGEEEEVLPTDEYFRLNVKVCLTCESCGYARSKEEMYRHLSIDVGDEHALNWSVETGLRLFFRPEEREIKCEKCDEGTKATQKMEIVSRPKALLLHLKRFVLTQNFAPATPSSADQLAEDGENKDLTDDSEPLAKKDAAYEEACPAVDAPFMGMTFRKNKARVILHKTITTHDFGAPATPGAAAAAAAAVSCRYVLRGVVHHIGGTSFSGHYTSDAVRYLGSGLVCDGTGNKSAGHLNASERWVDFDDRITTMTTLEKVLEDERSQRNAYMMLYELDA